MQYEVSTTTVCNVQPKELSWLWPDRFPLGKLTLLVGNAGLGKSLLTLDFAARISTGSNWPDNKPCKQGHVLLLSAEDDLADTVLPRLIVAGADLTNVSAISSMVKIKNKNEHIPFQLGIHTNLLGELIVYHQPRVVIIDPIGAFVGSTDTHNEAQVRSLLHPVSTLANATNVTFILVAHLRKSQPRDESSALHRIAGSVAFSGAARAVWGVGRDIDDPRRRVMIALKHNLALDTQSSLLFELQDVHGVPRVQWIGKVECEDKDEAMVGSGNKLSQKLSLAKQFLSDRLKCGAVQAGVLLEMAGEAGISARTLQRAREELGIITHRVGQSWYWQCP